MHDVIAAVARWSGLAADIVRRQPVVLITDNYDRLFYEGDAIARSARYSHYIDDTYMLRTHTTAGVPPLLAGTYAGVSAVDRTVVDAARSMGMSELRVLFRVEVPNALPLILGDRKSVV